MASGFLYGFDLPRSRLLKQRNMKHRDHDLSEPSGYYFTGIFHGKHEVSRSHKSSDSIPSLCMRKQEGDLDRGDVPETSISKYQLQR